VLLLALALVVIALVAATVGAAGIPLARVGAAFGFAHGDPVLAARDHLVLTSIRLPRIALTAIVGGLLAATGTIMQGLFRNPLAAPGLVGVSAGAGLAAACAIVLGDRFLGGVLGVSVAALPAAAFVGALVITVLLYRLSTRDGRTSIATFLLAGLA